MLDDLEKIKEGAISKMASFERSGWDKLSQYLQESDFFVAPASTMFHGAFAGGLLKHSYYVYKQLSQKVKDYNLDYSDETIFICGFLHDLCKVNYYVVQTEPATDAQIKYLASLSGRGGWSCTKQYATVLIDYYKNGAIGDVPKEEIKYQVKDEFPVGHGEKSVFLIQKFLQLTEEEVAAIRWHMCAFDAGIHFNYPSGFPFRAATEKYPLVTLLFTADYEVSNILKI